MTGLGVNDDDGFGISSLGEAERDGGAAVADGFVAGDLLRAVEMAEGGVVEAFKEVRADGAEVADVDVALAIAGGGTEGGEVAHGDDGAAQREVAASGELRGVVGTDAGANLLVHGGDGFTSGGLAEIALAQKGHGGDDGSTEINDVVFARVTKDMHVEAAEQLTRGVEVGGGVVITSGDDGLHGFEVGEALQELKVERDGILRRIRSIEDISTDEQCIDFFAAQCFDEPVDKDGVLRQAVTLDESGAEMPVCCVEDAHGLKI